MVKHENMTFLEIFEFNDLEGLHGLHCDCFVMELQLRHLVDSGLLEHAETRSGEVSIHDLYREFAGLEAQGHLIPVDMEERRWVYATDGLPTEMEDEPRSSWKKLTRVCISDPYPFVKKSGFRSPSAITWKYCTNLVVLKLDGLFELSGVLNFKDLIRLKSFTVKAGGLSPLKFSIEGLEGLNTLTYFSMVCAFEDRGANVGQLPAALKVLEVDAAVVFERDVLALCTNLVSLKLRRVCTSDLDLKSWTSLQEVELKRNHGLKILELGTGLQSVDIRDCSGLVEVCGLDRLIGLLSLELVTNDNLSKLSNLTGLKRLHTLKCASLDIDEVPGLHGLVGLKSLILSDCRRLSKLPSLTGLQCLRELEISGLGITEIPNLSGLEQLEVVDASRNSELTSLQGFGDLRTLIDLNLSRCESLCRLPDMREMTNLKKLDLRHTEVELHEEDIHMLEGLQALEPVLVSPSYDYSCDPEYGLDFKRHKIMSFVPNFFWVYANWQTWQNSNSGWEEKDLHHPSVAGYLVENGIKIRDVKTIWRLIPGPVTKCIGSDGMGYRSIMSVHSGVG